MRTNTRIIALVASVPNQLSDYLLISKCDELEEQLAALQQQASVTANPQVNEPGNTAHQTTSSGSIREDAHVSSELSLPLGLADDAQLLAWTNEVAPVS